MAQEVRIVPLLPDEDEVRCGHELGDERALVGRARKRVRTDAEPPRVVGARIIRPELLLEPES